MSSDQQRRLLEVFSKIDISKNFTKFTDRYLCQSFYFNKVASLSLRVSILTKLQASACKFNQKDALAQVFTCEFCDIFENIFL